MKRFLTTLAALALLSAAGRAAAMGKIFVGVGLSHSTADLATNDGAGFNSAYDHSEVGGRLEYWNQMNEHYALNFNGNLGFFSETDKPGTGAPASAAERKYTQSSWSARLGGDRTWNPLPNTIMFMGPGIEFWSGKAKFENIPGITNGYETENVKRISLHGQVGAIHMMGSNWGISGQLGHRIGVATYEEKGAKSTWWPPSLDGAMELVF